MELKELLKECKNNSVSAQKCLFDTFASNTFLLCRRFVRTDEDAEEMMFNGFLKILKGVNHFNYSSDAAVWAWIKKIMVNECLMHLRKKETFLISVDLAIEEQSNHETALEKLSADEIFKLITQLPIGYRTVFNLYAIEGYSHKEISVTLNITEGTSKSQLSKARKMLQQMVFQNEKDYEKRDIL
jgi:RNA polymerase sigma factor (sigma-70 family)